MTPKKCQIAIALFTFKLQIKGRLELSVSDTQDLRFSIVFNP